MKNILILAIIIIFCSGCEKNNPFDTMDNSVNPKNDSVDVTPGLIGSWAWLSSSPHNSVTSDTPATAKTLQFIVFTRDSIFKRYDDGKLVTNLKFHTYKSNPGLLIYSSGVKYRYSISNDTLRMRNIIGIISVLSIYKKNLFCN
jgi:hypothetical protein